MDNTELDLGHYLSVAKLQELLIQLKPDDILFPNAVGNLSIMRDENLVGYIDLLHVNPEVVIFD